MALDDLAHLMAPEQVVMCEGRPTDGSNPSKAEFDAKCYRAIFAAEYPDTDFFSVGNPSEVRTARLGVGAAIQTLRSGTTVLRVIDGDDRSEEEFKSSRTQVFAFSVVVI